MYSEPNGTDKISIGVEKQLVKESLTNQSQRAKSIDGGLRRCSPERGELLYHVVLVVSVCWLLFAASYYLLLYL
jgi:hypothetical protein